MLKPSINPSQILSAVVSEDVWLVVVVAEVVVVNELVAVVEVGEVVVGEVVCEVDVCEVVGVVKQLFSRPGQHVPASTQETSHVQITSSVPSAEAGKITTSELVHLSLHPSVTILKVVGELVWVVLVVNVVVVVVVVVSVLVVVAVLDVVVSVVV